MVEVDESLVAAVAPAIARSQNKHVEQLQTASKQRIQIGSQDSPSSLVESDVPTLPRLETPKAIDGQ
jgi:hypothetical protein